MIKLSDMKSSMVDDIRTPTLGEYGADFVAEILEIGRHRMNRGSSHQWARNLRFLAFDDDTSVKRFRRTSSLRSTSRPTFTRSCRVCSLRNDAEAEATPCEHWSEHSCQECQDITPFPKGQKVTKFRLLQLRDPYIIPFKPSVCNHYLAVS